MAKKNKAFMLNRKQYMQISKMDHCQLSAWVESVYKNAFKDGIESAEEPGRNRDEECSSFGKGNRRKESPGYYGSHQRCSAGQGKKREGGLTGG